MTLYDDRRQLVRLSEQCWNCLDVIRDVGYANTYTIYWADKIKLIQQAIRKIAPDIKGDWLRFHFEGKTVTFSLSDNAISAYKPKIQEFSSFGSAVRILGTYEDYVRKIAELSYASIAKDVQVFKNSHKMDISNTNSFVKSEVGRGIVFFKEVFNYNPNPAYEPSLEFFYQIRNITVHNSGIVDQKMRDVATNSFVKISGTLKLGMKIAWNLSILLQLEHLLTDMLPQIDSLVSAKLNLTQIEKRAYWYLDSST